MNRLTKIKEENKDWPYLRVVAGAQLTLEMITLTEPIVEDVIFGKDGIIINHNSDNIQYDYPNTITISGFPLKVNTNIAEFVNSYFTSEITEEETDEKTDETNEETDEIVNTAINEFLNNNKVDNVDGNIYDVIDNADSMNVISGYIISEKGRNFSISITGAESDRYLISVDGIVVRNQPILLEGENPVTVLKEFVDSYFLSEFIDSDNDSKVNSKYANEIIDIEEGKYAIIDKDSHSVRTITSVIYGPRLEIIGTVLFAPLEEFIINTSDSYTLITDKDVITLKPGSGFPINVNYTNGDETSNQITEYKFDDYNVFIEGLTFMYDYEEKALYYKNEVVTDINVYNNIVIINKNKVVMKNGKEYNL